MKDFYFTKREKKDILGLFYSFIENR